MKHITLSNMEIKEFLAQNPQAKDNPLKYAVESGMKFMHFDKSEREDIQNSILLQDFVEYVNDLVEQIKTYEKKD